MRQLSNPNATKSCVESIMQQPKDYIFMSPTFATIAANDLLECNSTRRFCFVFTTAEAKTTTFTSIFLQLMKQGRCKRPFQILLIEYEKKLPNQLTNT